MSAARELVTQPQPTLTDAQLVLAARDGERWAQEALFRRYARMVNGVAFRLLGSDSELDDLVQDAFFEALTSLERLTEPAAFPGWLRSVVVRTAYRKLRRRKLMRRLGLVRAEAIDFDGISMPSASAEEVGQLRYVYRVLDRMPADVRIAFILRRVEGMELQEVADHMNVSLATVKRKIAQADHQLGSREDDGGDE